jgi:hypothetical protein
MKTLILLLLTAALSSSTPTPVKAPVAAPSAPVARSIYMPNVPGVTNPNVTQDNIDKTICVSGWTKTIRPPVGYTNKLKKKQMAALGLTGKPSDYELDHLISIELGGNPTDPNNLWPEPWNGPQGAHIKDAIETHLKHLVCKRQITLLEAQTAIRTDWIAAYKKYIGPLGSVSIRN